MSGIRALLNEAIFESAEGTWDSMIEEVRRKEPVLRDDEIEGKAVIRKNEDCTKQSPPNDLRWFLIGWTYRKYLFLGCDKDQNRFYCASVVLGTCDTIWFEISEK